MDNVIYYKKYLFTLSKKKETTLLNHKENKIMRSLYKWYKQEMIKETVKPNKKR